MKVLKFVCWKGNNVKSILALVETRCSRDHANFVCNKAGFDHWTRIEALGFSRGIWLLWKDSVNVRILKTHPQFVHAAVSHHASQPWLLTIVYGSPNPTFRKSL